MEKIVSFLFFFFCFFFFFVFLIQRKVRILSKICDVHIEIKYISSNLMLFQKQL